MKRQNSPRQQETENAIQALGAIQQQRETDYSIIQNRLPQQQQQQQQSYFTSQNQQIQQQINGLRQQQEQLRWTQ